MIRPEIVETVDRWLDKETGKLYQNQPLAQDWARVGKVIEELGEAIAELILFTGQNPRKSVDPEAEDRMLNELADVAMTAIYAIQHKTKDIFMTTAYVLNAQVKHAERAQAAGYYINASTAAETQ